MSRQWMQLGVIRAASVLLPRSTASFLVATSIH